MKAKILWKSLFVNMKIYIPSNFPQLEQTLSEGIGPAEIFYCPIKLLFSY
jgi:hypothetical protein